MIGIAVELFGILLVLLAINVNLGRIVSAITIMNFRAAQEPTTPEGQP